MPQRSEGSSVGEVGPEVVLRVGDVRLAGNLGVPEEERGLVVFAHGSGSSRFSPGNRYVAGVLQDAGLGTLLFDLLTAPSVRGARQARDGSGAGPGRVPRASRMAMMLRALR